jgi:citronellol/citronellal dehydrogenase
MSTSVSSDTAGDGSLAGRTLLMSGGSRGIGLAIAERAAADGANVAIIAKTAEPHPKLEGTVYTAAKAIEDAGGRALPIVGDVRNDDDIASAVSQTVERFGGIDICINNASAIDLAGVDALSMKRYDLMQDINTRGTYALSQACVAHLRESPNPHILTLSPPITLEPRWLAPHTAYTIAKYGMTLCALGLAEELGPEGIASNALWPRTLVATAAVQNLLGGEAAMSRARKPSIYADAAYVVLTSDSRELTGRALLCEDVLVGAGITDLDPYFAGDAADLAVDLFVDSVEPG